MTFEELVAWQKDIEARVIRLEKELGLDKDEDPALVKKYGEYVDKTVAAQILGVTRATVYAMLGDGRLQGGCKGKKVLTASIDRYLRDPGKHRARRGEEDDER